MRKFSILITFLCAYCALLSARNYTISGYVSYAESGETMISATIFDQLSQKGTITNSFGFYTLTLPEGSVELKYSYIGCETQVRKMMLDKDIVLNISLEETVALDEITVVGRRDELGVSGSQMSAVTVPIKQLAKIPALAGEVDIIKALQLMPGVQSGGEGSAGLYVRGGGPEENLILLDGVPLYNVNHMMGFFSVFNADAIKNVTLYKGNFPARFGSRLSSVVDVTQKEGNAKSYHGSATIGILSAKLNLEGPIIKDKTTFNISGRRTYFDVLSAPFIKAMKGNGYYFYDLNAKITHKFSDKDKLSLSYYMGDDKIYIGTEESNKTYAYKVTSSQNMDMKWGNTVGVLNWYHLFTDKLFMNTTVAYTKYRFNMGMTMTESNVAIQQGFYDNINTNTISLLSSIHDQSINTALEYHPNTDHSIKFGANYTYHTFEPSVTQIRMQERETNQNINLGDQKSYTHEAAVYAEDNWSIREIVKLNMGLRASMYKTSKSWYPSIEPRLSARVMVSPVVSVKASYAYMSQYIHLLSNSNISLPTDLWVPVTNTIKPMNSNQFAIGAFYNFNNLLDISVEGYYKTMSNLLAYKDGASFMATTENWENKVVMGDGRSYGIELLIQKQVGHLTGWVGYTWSKALRQFDRPGQEINYGKEYYAKFDRRHDFSVTLAYKLSEHWDISSSFIFGSGNRGTLGLQKFAASNNDISFPEVNNNQSNNIEMVNNVSERNNYQMPNYHRLDFGATYTTKHQFGESVLNFSVYNVYNHLNPYLITIGQNDDGTSSLKQTSIFPIIPSISYTFKF